MKEATLVAIVWDEKQIAKGKKVQPINPLFSLKKSSKGEVIGGTNILNNISTDLSLNYKKVIFFLQKESKKKLHDLIFRGLNSY